MHNPNANYPRCEPKSMHNANPNLDPKPCTTLSLTHANPKPHSTQLRMDLADKNSYFRLVIALNGDRSWRGGRC